MAKLASSSGFALDFLRRLLCAGNADDAAAARHHLHPTAPAEPEAKSPCIVARLMGLDAMPPEPPPLRRKSRSAEGSPRVSRPSAPLREKPAYLRQESDEFLLLSFSPDPEEERRGDGDDLFFLAAADAAARGDRRPGASRKQRRARCRKLRFGDEEAAAVCDTQNSSPVSVLQAHEESSTTTTTSSSLEEGEHTEPCSATSEEAQFTLERQSSSSRKLQPDLDHQFDGVSAATRSTCQGSRCPDRERRNRRVVNKAEVITPDVAGIWQPICRLVEEDIKSMEWPARDGANVVAEMESGILDELIFEATAELVQERSETVHPFPLRVRSIPEDIRNLHSLCTSKL